MDLINRFYNVVKPAFILFLSLLCYSTQAQHGQIIGYIKDGTTNLPLAGVSVVVDDKDTVLSSSANGFYMATINSGIHSLSFQINGFQKKTIRTLAARKNDFTAIDIVLYPIFNTRIATTGINDSVSTMDTEKVVPFSRELMYSTYHPTHSRKKYDSYLDMRNMDAAVDRNTASLLKRLNGVVLNEDASLLNLHSMHIDGMGSRYNQLSLNGKMLTEGNNGWAKNYSLANIPVEAIASVSLQKIGDASINGDFSGGSIDIRTNDFPISKFIKITVEAGGYDKTTGKSFYSDPTDLKSILGFPGKARNLPGNFPTTRSRFAFNEKNIQEQIDLSRSLNNTITPVQKNALPTERVMIAMGNSIPLKNKKVIGWLAYLNQLHMERKDFTTTQVLPILSAGSFPLNTDNRLIGAFSEDIYNKTASQLNAGFNASLLFGRNKISFKNMFNSNYHHTYIQRSFIYKQDEDSLANAGINLLSEKTLAVHSQLSGEHGLGENGRFKMDWLAAYSYHKQENPDEINFLLRQEGNKDAYEIATAQSAPIQLPNGNLSSNFTNSHRLWRSSNEHSFTSALNMKIPINLFQQVQLLSGGFFMQSNNKVFNSDLFLYTGKGYHPLHQLLDADKYYPGGTSLQNYFVNTSRQNNNGKLYANNKGSYTGASFTTASYLMMLNRFSKQVFLNWGLRFESNSLLVSNIQYEYLEGYKNPQKIALDENATVSTFKLLPSAKLMYQPSKKWDVYAAYFKTLNRPQFQELTDYSYYNAPSFMVITGNPFLKTADINNFKMGVQWMPNANTILGISGFYKQLFQPIEYVLSPYSNSRGNQLMTPFNMPNASVKGVNFSVNLHLNYLKNHSWIADFSFFANASLLTSKVNAGYIRNTPSTYINEHQLAGTPDYLLNGGIVFRKHKFPSVTVIYSLTDDYLQITGSGKTIDLANGKSISTIPDYRVKGRSQLDIQVSQQLLKSRITISGGAHNIFSSDFITYQDLNGNKKMDDAIILSNKNGVPGYYKEGTDNTPHAFAAQINYYFNISFIF